MQKLFKLFQSAQVKSSTKPAAVVELSTEEIKTVAGARYGRNRPAFGGRYFPR